MSRPALLPADEADKKIKELQVHIMELIAALESVVNEGVSIINYERIMAVLAKAKGETP